MEPITPTQPAASPAQTERDGAQAPGPLSRRGFLGVAGAVGLTAVAASVAACQAATAPTWSFGPAATAAAATAAPATAAPASVAPTAAPATTAPSVAPSPSLDPNIPAGWTSHDVAARQIVRRYVGNLAPALKGIFDPVSPAIFEKLAAILGAADGYPELSLPPAFAVVSQLYLNDIVAPLTPTKDGDVSVYDMTIDEIFASIDEMKAPVAALGYNKQWPAPTIRAKKGEKLRFHFTNNLKETTGVHFHGVEFADFFQDGVPFVTQLPIAPGETFTYEFTAERSGSLMYHSHHNATDQVGRGLLGAFIVDDATKQAPAWDSEYTWISNDALGGFTINGHGFPAVVPVLAYMGERVLIRFMNEGTMMHPWHSHGYRMRVIARDGYPLGSAEFDCDVLGVNPGERYDVVITADRPGIWAFHCHILPHVEGTDGMFGMVSTLIVLPTKADKDAVVQAVASQYKPA
ncbi:MAG: multicopper oxidase domain-containing protein [Chloroflexota bacterium]